VDKKDPSIRIEPAVAIQPIRLPPMQEDFSIALGRILARRWRNATIAAESKGSSDPARPK
jgi:hypothetical protein